MTGARALQWTVACLAVVPVAAGAAGVIAGPAVVGAPPSPATADLDSHFRYLSGLLLAIGVGFLATVPSIERRTAAFRGLSAIVATGGAARLLALLQAGPPSPQHLAALALELVVVPLLALWQGRVARRAGISPPAPPPPASRGTP